ncbi:Endonuclease-reverse transcriptase, partial [Fasciola hepatica]
VCCAAVRSVLLCGCKTWGLRVEDIRRLEVFDHRCLHSITKIGWNSRVRNAEVRKRVFSTSSENVLSQRIQVSRLRWFGHVLHMANTHLSHRALSRPSSGVEVTTWRSTDDVAARNEKMYS